MKSVKSIFIILLFFISTPVYTFAQNLSLEQDLWLAKRNKTVIVRPERNYPPFDFVSKGSTGKPQGLGIDYLELIAQKINIKLQYSQPDTLSNILADIKNGKDGVVIGVMEIGDRSDYLYFTTPFIDVPAVIIVRKDYPSKKDGFTLADFTGKRVAVAESYAAESYIKSNYKKIIIEPVSDDEIGLQKLLLGEVEAAVMDIASLSYYTANKALSYVVVGGQTGFEYKLSFGVPKNTPELLNILNTGLGAITPQEKNEIKEKWINMTEIENTSRSFGDMFNGNILLIIGIIIVGGIVFIFTILIIMNSLRKAQMMSTFGYLKKSKPELEELKNELEELEHASDVVNKELEQIHNLEKKIQDKINNS